MSDTQKMIHETRHFCLQHDGKYMKLWLRNEQHYHFRKEKAYPGDDGMLILREHVIEAIDPLVKLHGFVPSGVINDFEQVIDKLLDLPF